MSLKYEDLIEGEIYYETYQEYNNDYIIKFKKATIKIPKSDIHGAIEFWGGGWVGLDVQRACRTFWTVYFGVK